MWNEEKAEFLETILLYQNWKEVSPKTGFKFIRPRVKSQMDIDKEKREKVVEVRSEVWRLWWLAKASKSKQTQANASKRKQSVADNVNDNVNDNVISSKEEQSIALQEQDEYGKQEINQLIMKLKEKCNELGVAYNKANDRNFANHICKAKEFWEFAEKIGSDRIKFACDILVASKKISYWKGVCSWPMMIYQNYADVYNKAMDSKKPTWWGISVIS